MTRLIVVAGPTASGKSALALRLAEAERGVIINADSMQLYRDLRLLTARPTPEDQARAPHEEPPNPESVARRPLTEALTRRSGAARTRAVS